MQQLILVFHVLVAAGLIALVLIQHGKGADVGAAFGSGASNTMFGSQGSTPFLMKVTYALAAIFFITSLGLNYLVAHEQREAGAIKILQPTTTTTVPVSPSSSGGSTSGANPTKSGGLKQLGIKPATGVNPNAATPAGNKKSANPG